MIDNPELRNIKLHERLMSFLLENQTAGKDKTVTWAMLITHVLGAPLAWWLEKWTDNTVSFANLARSNPTEIDLSHRTIDTTRARINEWYSGGADWVRPDNQGGYLTITICFSNHSMNVEGAITKLDFYRWRALVTELLDMVKHKVNPGVSVLDIIGDEHISRMASGDSLIFGRQESARGGLVSLGEFDNWSVVSDKFELPQELEDKEVELDVTDDSDAGKTVEEREFYYYLEELNREISTCAESNNGTAVKADLQLHVANMVDALLEYEKVSVMPRPHDGGKTGGLEGGIVKDGGCGDSTIHLCAMEGDDRWDLKVVARDYYDRRDVTLKVHAGKRLVHQFTYKSMAPAIVVAYGEPPMMSAGEMAQVKPDEAFSKQLKTLAGILFGSDQHRALHHATKKCNAALAVRQLVAMAVNYAGKGTIVEDRGLLALSLGPVQGKLWYQWEDGDVYFYIELQTNEKDSVQMSFKHPVKGHLSPVSPRVDCVDGVTKKTHHFNYDLLV